MLWILPTVEFTALGVGTTRGLRCNGGPVFEHRMYVITPHPSETGLTLRCIGGQRCTHGLDWRCVDSGIAEGTDTYELNRNLLSDGARADSLQLGD